MTLTRAVAVIEQGIEEGLHLGGQLHVSHHGRAVADLAVGDARAGTPMTTDTRIIWWSMTKPTVAVSVMQQWERGHLHLDDLVTRFVPEFGANGKEAVTIRHLLTHTAGFRSADGARGPWDDKIAQMAAAPLEPRWVPGRTAGYHLTAGMTMLAEIIRRIDGRPFERYVREELFEPLGMDDCWVGMPADVAAGYLAEPGRIGAMHSGEDPMKPGVLERLRPLDDVDSAKALGQCNPGGGGRGPMHQLAKLYEALLAGGGPVLGEQTVEAMAARHRAGLYDKTFGAVVDWGLGVGIDTYTMGPHCSPRAFGHGGARSSQALADPEHGLVVCALTNGMPPTPLHQQRFWRLMQAVYVDLGIASAEDPGREKVPGKYA